MGDNKISEEAPALWGVRIGDSDTWGYVEVESDADFIGRKSGLSYEKRPFYTHLQGEAVPVALDRYDTGLLGDGGGGDVNWWWDYIRSELDRAHEFYQDQVAHPQPAELNEVSGDSGELVERQSAWNDSARLACLESWAREPGGLLLHAESGTGRRGLGLGENCGRRTLAQAIDSCATHSEKDSFAAIAATGKQQAGEVLGSREQFEAWYTQNAFDYVANPVGSRECALMWKSWQAAIASRQPVCLSPIANRKLEELAAQGYVTTGVAIFNPETGKRGLVDNLGYVGWQGIDLGQFREAVLCMKWAAENGHGQAAQITRADRLLALLDGRDAGAGVKS